uniref:Secreted protein n=1 Tax=Anopheles darlingi TaxID=43151 RepID=A0A2M4DT05_ANODA
MVWSFGQFCFCLSSSRCFGGGFGGPMLVRCMCSMVVNRRRWPCTRVCRWCHGERLHWRFFCCVRCWRLWFRARSRCILRRWTGRRRWACLRGCSFCCPRVWVRLCRSPVAFFAVRLRSVVCVFTRSCSCLVFGFAFGLLRSRGLFSSPRLIRVLASRSPGC